MLIGLINYNGLEYRIYKEKNSLYAKMCNLENEIYLNESEVKNVLDEIFNFGTKKYIESKKGYDLYIDEYGNKRFFKDSTENYHLFYLFNGTDATMYIFPFKHFKRKLFRFGRKKRIIIICTLGLLITYESLGSSIYPLSEIKFVIEQKVHERFYGNYTSEELINALKSSKGKNLDATKKEFFSNKDFIDDVLKYGNDNRVSNLVEKLSNFEIDFYDEKEKKENNSAAMYNPLKPNKIFLRDELQSTFNYSASHEFIHLFQQPYRYIYIKEASAEIFAHEYFNKKLESYSEIVKRVYFLTEIVGPDLMFEANFNFYPHNFEEEIITILGEEEGKQLLELFETNPENRDIEVINKKIDKYLIKMYKIKYGDKEYLNNKWYIDKIYDTSSLEYVSERSFFNRHRDSFYTNVLKNQKNAEEIEIQLSEINDCEVLKIFIEDNKILTKEEFDNYYALGMNVLKTKTNYVLTGTREINSIKKIDKEMLKTRKITVIFNDGFCAQSSTNSLAFKKTITDTGNYYKSFKKTKKTNKNAVL